MGLDNEATPPRQGDAAHDLPSTGNDPTPSVNGATDRQRDVAAVLELSHERDRYLQRIFNAEVAGFNRGWDRGYAAGYLAAVADIKETQQITVAEIRKAAPLWAAHWRTLKDAKRLRPEKAKW